MIKNVFHNKFLIILCLCILKFIFSFSQVQDSNLCNYAKYNYALNLGLTGASANDLATSRITDRIFMGVTSPQSLFISDDTGTTWYPAFPLDSLSYECDLRGWGGGAQKIQVNNNGVVAVLTGKLNSNFTACIINANNGDTLSWKTALDLTLMANLGYLIPKIFDLALSDSFLFMGAGRYIVKYEISNANYTVFDFSSGITSINPDSLEIFNIGTSASKSGYPIYFIAHDAGINDTYAIYKYDGTNLQEIVYPSDLNSILKLFIHPLDSSGDTLFISGLDTSITSAHIYRTYNAGISWQDISHWGTSTDLEIDMDLISDWQNTFLQSMGGILFIDGKSYSTDLGTSWNDFSYQGSCSSVNPNNSDISYAVFNKLGLYLNKNSFAGSYDKRFNKDLYALTINKMALSTNKHHAYVATPAGIGYTTVYSDTTINGKSKWEVPYGAYPLFTSFTLGNVFAVAVNPYDTNHIVAGTEAAGFIYSKSGYQNFKNSLEAGFDNSTTKIRAVQFVDSSIVIGVTAGKNYMDGTSYGDIWRSEDGGENWVIVTPSGFNNGNAIAVGRTNTDTSIYVGTGMTGILYTQTTTSASGYLWKSDDKGLSWQLVNSGPHGVNDSTVSALPIQDIIVDPRGNDTIYMAAGYYNEYAFVRSIDGGLTYSYPTTQIDRQAACTSLEFLSSSYDTVLFSIQSDIYYYDAINNTTDTIYRGYPAENIPDLQSGSILVGTTTGFYLLDIEVINDLVDLNSKQSLIPGIKIFPNPNTGRFFIESEFNLKGFTIEIFSILGKKLLVQHIDIDTYIYSVILDSFNASENVYLVQIKSNTNEIWNYKLLLQK